jgi:bifunctional non-homologous end joining protein LigD
MGHAKVGERDTLELRGVRISSPDKVLWPEQGVTKGELARYWDAVMEHALPLMRGRPLTLYRCPAGIHRSCFFQKHHGQGMPERIPGVMVEEKDGRAPYMYVDSPASLLALIQMGVLELHVWGARADRLDRPDLIVMDVDPAPDVPWPEVRDAARLLRGLLAELGLASWPRSTGGKGLHVVAPLARRSSWEDVTGAARRLSERMAEAEPERFLSKASKEARTGRIYIDWLRNVPNATAIATLSPRAREGAPVALPLSWEALDAARTPPGLTVPEVERVCAHLAGDPWAGFLEARQSLTRKALDALGV